MNTRSCRCFELLGTVPSVFWFGGEAMKIKPGRRQRRVSKQSYLLNVEFLERRVVLNADPTGSVLIAGSPFEGQELVASNTLTDADGLGPIAYQWKSDNDPIADATSPTYVLQDVDVAKVITVVATYTDLQGAEEVVSSQPTAAVGSRLSLRDVIIDDGSSITDINLQAGYLHSNDGFIYVSIDSSMSVEQQGWWLEVFADADSLIEPEFAIVPKSSSLSQLTVYQLQSDYTSDGGSGVYIGPSALIYQDGTVERTSEARIELGQSVYSHSIRFAESLEAGWKSVAYHELGHAMGLEHPHEWGDGDGNTIIDSNTTVMSYEQAIDADGSPGYTWLDEQALTYIHGAETGAIGVPVEGTLLADLGPFDTAQSWKTPSLSMAFEGGDTVNEPSTGAVTKRLALTRYDGYLGNGATVFLDWQFGSELYWTPQTESPEWYRDIMFGGSYPSQVVFQPDQQVAYVDITVFGDERIEGEEWFSVTARESRSPGYFQAFPTETLRLVLAENAAPTSVVLSSISVVLDENTPTTSRQKLADIQVTDDGSGINSVSLSGPDAAAFEVDGTELFLKAGLSLNVNVQSSYAVTVSVSDDSLVGSSPVTTQFTLTVNRPPAASYSPDYTTINGRNFGYYVPESYDPSTPTPLLFMFHGLGGNSSEQSGGSAENSYYGWQTTAHENGFIVLFPESLGFLKTWDLGGGGSSSDLSFVDDMIGWASTNYNISTSQIFTTGHSWGAYFSYYVATYRSDDIAAFGAHSGGLGGAFLLGNTPPVPTGPNPTPALNGIILHAVDDAIVPYSNSQNLYDGLLANGHNVYDDGIGADGIIEVDGWGPDNHRYRLQHNQTQWDFFLSVAPNPVTSNQPPEFNQPVDLVLNEDAPLQSITLTGISSGDGVEQPVRVSATSSNPGLIPAPTVSYTNSSDTGSLVVAPVADQFGAATITVTVEDGGLDNVLETAGDNAIVSQTFEVTVLEMLSYEGSLPLSQNAAGNLYVDKEPVFTGAEKAQVNIRGFQVLGADDTGAQKSLLVRRDNHLENPVRCRVLTDDVWRISNMFDSLTNETHQSMDASARDVVYEFPASVLPGTTIGNLPSQYETSGLTWHDGLQKLFAVSDEGIVSMMNADGSDIVNWNVPGDLEALTVADHTSNYIYIGVENPDSILEFDVTTGQVTRTFDLTDWMTGADNRGLEALAFVPDATHPEGGLFYAGLQSDGRIYQFALPIVSSSSSTAVTFVQSMAIEGGSTDLAGLAYDPSSDLLLAMFDSMDQLNVIDRDGQLRSRWNVSGVGQEAVILVDGQFYVGDDSLFSITLYAGFDLLTA